MKLKQQRYHRRKNEEGSIELEDMGCEQIRIVQHRQENQSWQKRERNQTLCIRNFYA